MAESIHGDEPAVADSVAAPLEATGADRPSASVAERLRTMIVTGNLPPGAELSQVKLAQLLGVSTTPLREALRQLEAEGLVESRRNRRPRVASFDVRDLEGVYSARVLLESLGTALSVPRMTDETIAQLEHCLDGMRKAAAERNLDHWHTHHSGFHAGLVSLSNPSLRQQISTLAIRSELYRRVSVLGDQPLAWSTGESEHESIFEACRDREPTVAAALLAQHLSRSALTVVAHLAPTSDPVGLRVALQMVMGWQVAEALPEELRQSTSATLRSRPHG